MKAPQNNPESPQTVNAITRELRLIQVGDGELRNAPNDDRQHAVRAGSARRRLFADEPADEPADEQVAAGGSSADEGPRRRRLAEPLVLYELRPQDDPYRMLSEELSRASRRWNFDFINDRPLDGPWLWQKVVPREQLPVIVPAFGDVNGNTEPMELADGCQSPQR